MIYADDILSSGSRDVLTDIANKLSGLLEVEKSQKQGGKKSWCGWFILDSRSVITMIVA